MNVAASLAFLLLPFSIPVIIANIVLFGVGSPMAGEALYKPVSQELFPTCCGARPKG